MADATSPAPRRTITIGTALGLILAFILIAIVIGWARGARLLVQVRALGVEVVKLREEMDALHLELLPVAPIDVLCGVSLQMERLHAEFAARCGGKQAVPGSPLPRPLACQTWKPKEDRSP